MRERKKAKRHIMRKEESKETYDEKGRKQRDIL